MPARPDPESTQPEAVIILVTASWCLPCRPARTVLQELQRRWGARILPVVIDADDADPRLLEQLDVDQLPTWIVLRLESPESSESQDDPRGETPTAGDGGAASTTSPSPQRDAAPAPERAPITGERLDGSRVQLSSAWIEAARRVGAAPKLEVLDLVQHADESFPGT